MRFGIATPIVSSRGSAAGAWEAVAGGAEFAAVAEAAERLGYHHLTCSEHVALPHSMAKTRGLTYWDPLATLSYVAARTERILLVTNVLVLAYHHPIQIAKAYGTLDRLSGGRLVLGLGVGSLVEEFKLLGAPFDDRGARADDALRALRASLGQREPSYSGPFYEFSGMVVDPHAIQARVPFWMGGRTRRSLRRAVEQGDGWMPFGLSLDEVAAMVSAAGAPAGFEVVLLPESPLDAMGAPEQVRATLDRMVAAGCTLVNVRVVHNSLAHYVEQLEAFAELTGLAGSERGAHG